MGDHVTIFSSYLIVAETDPVVRIVRLRILLEAFLVFRPGDGHDTEEIRTFNAKNELNEHVVIFIRVKHVDVFYRVQHVVIFEID